MADLGKVGIVAKGTWSNSSTYEVLDAVSYNNGFYIAKQAVPAGTAPSNTTYWQAALTYEVGSFGCVRVSNESITDFNDMTIGTWLYGAAAVIANISHNPGNSFAGSVYCINGYNSNPWQIAKSSSSNAIFIRTKNGSTWTSWGTITIS